MDPRFHPLRSEHAQPVPLASCLRACLAAAAMHGSAWADTLPPPLASPPPSQLLEYDPQGNLIRRTLALQTSDWTPSRTVHDRLGRPREQVNEANHSIRLERDTGAPHELRVLDPRNLVTRYTRDGFGQVRELGSPDTGVAVYGYSAAGEPASRLDSRGVQATFTHDAIGRPTLATYQGPTGTVVHTLRYDEPEGGPQAVGQLTSASWPGGSAAFGYDAQGRLARAVQRYALPGRTTELETRYTYHPGGHVDRLVYPSGRVLHYDRSQGRIVGLSMSPRTWDPGRTLLSGIQYEAGPGEGGRPTQWNWHLDTRLQPVLRLFDVYGRLVRHPLGGAERYLAYDDANRITAYSHLDGVSGQATAAATALNQSFTYDRAGRLMTVSTPQASWVYDYDANGNRTRLQLSTPTGGLTQVSTIDGASNRLLALDQPPRQLQHDAAGNLHTQIDGPWARRYTHDATGRMTGGWVDGPQGRTAHAHAYNPWGQRVARWRPLRPGCVADVPSCNSAQDSDADRSQVTLFVYDTEGRLLGEYDAAGQPLREYVWLQDMPAVVLQGRPLADTVLFLYTDHLDTPRVAIDSAGRQRWSWVAEPFGNSAAVTNPLGLGPVDLPLRMPGQLFDADTGLLYNWHRHYDAGVGRYTQSDPIGLAGGINTYSYVGGNPLSYVDPRGLAGCKWVGPALICDVGPPPVVDPDYPSSPSASSAGFRNPFEGLFKNPKPRWVTGKQESYWDAAQCYEGDPCQQLKAYVRQANRDAKGKQGRMETDAQGLFRNAYSTPNPSVTGSPTTWMGHWRDLRGLIGKINEMIAMGQRMGCDMSEEIVMMGGLYLPNAPRNP